MPLGKILSGSEASASHCHAPVLLLQMTCLGGNFPSIPPPAHPVLQLQSVHAVGDGVTDGLRQWAMNVGGGETEVYVSVGLLIQC